MKTPIHFKVLEFQDNTHKMEKANRGKLSLNDTVLLRESKMTGEVWARENMMDEASRPDELLEGERIREVSVRDFILNDEFKSVGNVTKRTRLLMERSQLPLSPSLSHYLNAIFKRNVPDPAVYGYSEDPKGTTQACNETYHRFEVDFSPVKGRDSSPVNLNFPLVPEQPINPLHRIDLRSFGPQFGPPRLPPGSPIFLGGLVIDFSRFKKSSPVEVADGKFLLSGSRHGFNQPDKVENPFWPHPIEDQKFELQCLKTGEVQVSKIKTSEESGKVKRTEVGRYQPQEIKRWGLDLQDSKASSQKEFPQALQNFIWSLMTGFNTLIS